MADPRSTPSVNPERELGTVVACLRRRAGSTLPAQDLETAALQGLERFRDARVRDFVPLLVERQVRDDLRILAADRPVTGR
jgi:hypothetical protein